MVRARLCVLASVQAVSNQELQKLGSECECRLMGSQEAALGSSSVHLDDHRCFLKLETSYQSPWLRLGPHWLHWIDNLCLPDPISLLSKWGL